MTITREDIMRVSEELNGTCNSLDEVLQSLFGIDSTQVPTELLTELDGEVFCCEACGWWCETNELEDEDHICRDCRDE